MTYSEFTRIMRDQNNKDLKRNLKGRVVITEDSFKEKYSLEARTYAVSNDNKAFISGMGGYSIYAGSCDTPSSDHCCRLEAYLKYEHGGENGWEVEECYFIEDGKEIRDYQEMRELLGLEAA